MLCVQSYMESSVSRLWVFSVNHVTISFSDSPNWGTEQPAIHKSDKAGRGSTTVVYTVVWRNSVVWWEGGNTALWLVRKRIFLVYTQVWITRLCVPLQPITAPCFPLLIKPGNFAKRQCKLQWMTTPPIYASRKIQGLILNQGRVYPVLNP